MSANTDLKTSVLVSQEVPEFVREEYPTFVAFLEAYYEFLETKQGTQKNDLTNQAKKLRTIRDVDDSVEEFETNFYNTYATLLPLDVQADKALLFKQLVPLYKTKGSDASFKLLFRLVFGEDIDVILPKNNVLKSSSSKWQIDNKLRINSQISSRYVANGSNKTFVLAQISGREDIVVYVNGTLQTSGYNVRKEYRKLIFDTAPANNSVITVTYTVFDTELLKNRQVTGLTSGATAIIENATQRIISDSLNVGLPIELLIDAENLTGEFLNGENVTIPIIDANGILIDIRASTFSVVKSINLISLGANYNVGDPVYVTGGNATSNAIGTIESIYQGIVERILVAHGGAVFGQDSPIGVFGNTSQYGLEIVVDGIDRSGTNAANSFVVSDTLIGSFANVYTGYGVTAAGLTLPNPGAGYSNGYLIFSGGGAGANIPANASVEVNGGTGVITAITINSNGSYADPTSIIATPNSAGDGTASISVLASANYALTTGIATTGITSPNITTNIRDILTYTSIPVGPISNVKVLNSSMPLTVNPIFDAFGAAYGTDATTVTGITANTGSVGVNSFVIFSGGAASNSAANARIYVDTAGYVVNVNVSYGGFYVGNAPTAIANTGNISLSITTATLAQRTPKNLRSVGRFKINDRGSNYRPFDEIVFGPNPMGTYGKYAEAVVSEVYAANGAIRKISLANTAVDGLVSITSGSTIIIGSGTNFNRDLRVGDIIDVNGESRIIATISPGGAQAGVESLTPFIDNATNVKLRVANRYPLGGFGYTQNNFPTVSVSSATGVGASIEIDSLVSDGDRLAATGVGTQGSILSIKVLDPGAGYEYIPSVEIRSATGTGATANATIERSYDTAQGRWTTSDSILSTTERKLAGRDYYVDYSYIISSRVEFYRYKTLLKELLHPVGFVKYAEYKANAVIDLYDIGVVTENPAGDEQFLTISGRVNVGNGSIVVSGLHDQTKFNIANSKGIISLGLNDASFIAVNGEIRRVNSIISNTKILTSAKINDINITNAGLGYSNGYVNFTGGGGRLTSATLTYPGSGYANGTLLFTGADEAIPAYATLEVFASNGSIRNIDFVSGGLYSQQPTVTFAAGNDPHKVLYANTITVTNPGAGYTNGFFDFTDAGATGRTANIEYTVYTSNGGINVQSFVVNDSGLFEGAVILTPNTKPNTTIAFVNIANAGIAHANGTLLFNDKGVISITANAGSVVQSTGAPGATPVNTFITFSGGGLSNTTANARVYVNTAGYIVNVTLWGTSDSTDTLIPQTANGIYFSTPAATVNSVIDGLSYSNAIFTVTTSALYTNRPAFGLAEVYSSNGSLRKVTVLDSGLYSANSYTIKSIAFPPNSTSAVNSYVIFTGGTASNTRNVSANALIYVNTTGHIVNVKVISAGLYTNSAITAVSNTGVTLTLNPVQYPQAILNTTPISITTIAANSITHYGRAHQNGYIRFTGGDPIVNANVTYTVDANGVVNAASFTVVTPGLYRSAPRVSVDNNAVSITEAYPTSGGSGYSEGYLIIMGGSPLVNTALTTIDTRPISNANIRLVVDATTGTIVRSIINTVGLYANSGNISVDTAVLNVYPNVVTVSSITVPPSTTAVNSFIVFTGGGEGNTAANARVYVDSSGFVVNVVVQYPGSYWGLPYAVLNTNPSLTLVTVTMNANPAVAVNSFITFTNGGPLSLANTANARIFVDARGYIQNINVSNAGIYTTAPTANANTGNANGGFTISMGPTIIYASNGRTQNGSGAKFRLSYNSNSTNIANLIVSTTANNLHTANLNVSSYSNSTTNASFTIVGVSNAQTNAVITLGFVGQNTAANANVEVYNNSSGLMPLGTVNGAIRRIVITANGEYYYPPTITPNSSGTGGLITLSNDSIGIFTQTANLQTMIIHQSPSIILAENYYQLTTDDDFELLAIDSETDVI